MGYPVKPTESLVNSLGYHYLIKEQFEKAAKYFKMNVANFPGSYRCYDAYGDYFNAVGNTGDAVKNYKKSLSLNSRSPSKIKLEKIRKERGSGNAP
jgi:Tfp pilus assembly protein PilF